MCPARAKSLATGELDFVDSAVDTASGTIAAKAKFANEKFALWPGMYVDVEIDLDVRPKTVMIPTVAIQSGQDGPFVFVVTPERKADMRKIELAGIEGDLAALASGVNEGERVIVEGQMRLVDGANVTEGTPAPPSLANQAWRNQAFRNQAFRNQGHARAGRGRRMNISEFCIRHPVATTLMSAALVVSGLFAYVFLPVAALPRTEFPTINVSASLPGASPDTMANAVSTPLIKQFSTISGIDTISATSSQGSVSIAVQFELSRDIDSAAADIQSAIARVQRRLPTEMTEPPSYRKVNPADAPILILTLSSNIAPLPDMDAFAQQVISPALSTIEGVAQVQVFGSQKYAVRVQLNPDALAARGIGVDEVQQAIGAANANTPIGTLKNRQQSLTLQALTELSNADQFRGIIVAVRGDRPVRLGELAVVTDSVEDNQTASWYNGTRAILLGVYRQPEANTVEVVDRIKALLPSFESQLPRGAALNVLNDRSTSIRDAVHDVQLTLGLTVILVILVIFLFLRKVAATIIPALAVPISLIATLGAMYLFNFSIDNISLLALTLAVGLVVDDAIVMVENIHRHMEEDGLGAFEAALKGSREIGFTIISITISLVAVFIPVLLMGGIIGRIFNEFAVVVTVAIAASAFVSLTLTPMLAAKILPPPEKHDDKGKRQGGWSGYFERGFDAVLRGYDRTLRTSLRHKPWMLAVFFATLAGTAWLLVVTPKGLFPQEDIGQLSVSTEARQDISFEAMVALQQQAADAIRRSPHVANVASIVGGNALNAGRMFVELKPRGERPALQTVLADLRRDTARIAGIRTVANPVQNLRIGGRSSRAEYQFVVQGLNRPQLYEYSKKMNDAMSRDPLFADVNSDLQINATQATLIVDKDKAASLGISASQLRSTLVFRIRQPSGVDHLRHRRQLRGGDGVQREGQLDHRGASRCAHPQQRGKARADRRVRADRANGGIADHQPARPASGGDLVVQPAARRVARRRGDADRGAEGRAEIPGHAHDGVRGQRQDLSGFCRQPGHPADRRRGDDLYRARHPVRELHPSVHDPHRSAVGGDRGAAGAAAVRHGPEPDRGGRAADADRHRQEKRDHDDRRGADDAARGQGVGGGDLRSGAAAFPADHDDHAGGAPGRAADRGRHRRRRGVAPAARRGAGRRSDRVAGADAVHDADAVHLHGATGRGHGTSVPQVRPAAGGRGQRRLSDAVRRMRTRRRWRLHGLRRRVTKGNGCRSTVLAQWFSAGHHHSRRFPVRIADRCDVGVRLRHHLHLHRLRRDVPRLRPLGRLGHAVDGAAMGGSGASRAGDGARARHRR